MEKQTIKRTMEDRVLEYLEKYGTISSWEAIKELGCTRLSHYIWLLRKKYMINDKFVETTNRFGDQVKYKQYWIEYKY